jgi:hypothetical protein
MSPKAETGFGIKTCVRTKNGCIPDDSIKAGNALKHVAVKWIHLTFANMRQLKESGASAMGAIKRDTL